MKLQNHEKLTRAFLKAHPEFIPDCQKVSFTGREPELAMTIEGTIAFCEWCLKRGYTKQRAKTRDFIKHLKAVKVNPDLLKPKEG